MSLTSIRLKEAWNWGGLSAKELAKRTWKAIDQHDTLNQAAVIAFYAMLSLVPLLGFILAISLGARSGVADQVVSLSRTLPGEAGALVRSQIEKMQTGTPVGVLSFSAIVLLWSASSLFVAVMDTTNAAYGVRDERPFWKKRLMALLLTLVEAALLVGATILLVAWPSILGYLERIGHIQPGGVGAVVATVGQWLLVVLALFGAFAVAYYFGPHVEQKWEWVTPGGALGVLVLILATLGFRVYLYFGSSYSETYGALAGVVLMLLWMYIAALALLVGAEVNCVIEHASPHGKDPGEKKDPTT